jgi:hypothetical protein
VKSSFHSFLILKANARKRWQLTFFKAHCFIIKKCVANRENRWLAKNDSQAGQACLSPHDET